ncbi:hypothetical protein [Arenibacter sp. ARW7G5Y1]|uniref:hypothetical protein n=1 Tax=Arenibacter sp. ARW7G5Y1 TaxID=2135619 RepID=UPI000D75A304|nr:hypothetical protein [Arenibacter sp. ARW7G5Y1]PXX27362.1 hypothetical protein C7972_107147 [Arenibacter sp. ARW7G5Y1]
MKKYIIISIIFCIQISCSKNSVDQENGEENKNGYFVDSFDTNGTLINFVTNNPSALPNVSSESGRYKAILTDNTDDVTLHFNNSQGRIDAKLVKFPFEFIARNIGIGTLNDSQISPTPNNGPYVFCGVQVHHKDFNSINSSHVVVGHRGSTGYTIEGKNTVEGVSNVNDIGSNTVPQGRGDIRIVGNKDKTLTVYWQTPNLAYTDTDDNWKLYKDTGDLPGISPNFGSEVYIGLITYAFGQNGVPFVGTCDAIQIMD